MNSVTERLHDYTGHYVLLAEDMAINREVLRAMLEPTNLKLDCAGNGCEAVRMFSENPDKYSMIFMDIQMPEMNGYDATRRIRELGVRGAGEIPIIAMTANILREDIEKCLDAGMNAHIGKPIDLDKVIGVLERYICYTRVR